MRKQLISTLAFGIVSAAGFGTGAWACDSADNTTSAAATSTAVPCAAAPTGDAADSQSSPAATKNGMQVINLAPSQGTTVYATVEPGGEVTISHAPAVDASESND